jgi:hypothetical protein
MKVPCKKCNREMEYPFMQCTRCGWKPEGELAEKAKAFARKYAIENKITAKGVQKSDQFFKDRMQMNTYNIGLYKMKVPCKNCKREMKYPFQQCRKCGWRPEGELAEKAKEFARKYEMTHGIEQKEAEAKRSVPGLVKPVPGKDQDERLEKGAEVAPKKIPKEKPPFRPEIVECPKCGKDIIIDSPERPIKIACRACGAKIKILN